MIAQLKKIAAAQGLKTLVMILSHNRLSSLKATMPHLVLIHYEKKLNTSLNLGWITLRLPNLTSISVA